MLIPFLRLWRYLPTYHMVIFLIKLMDITRVISIHAFYYLSFVILLFCWTTSSASCTIFCWSCKGRSSRAALHYNTISRIFRWGRPNVYMANCCLSALPQLHHPGCLIHLTNPETLPLCLPMGTLQLTIRCISSAAACCLFLRFINTSINTLTPDSHWI